MICDFSNETTGEFRRDSSLFIHFVKRDDNVDGVETLIHFAKGIRFRCMELHSIRVRLVSFVGIRSWTISSFLRIRYAFISDSLFFLFFF